MSHVLVFDRNCTACHDGQETINNLFDHDQTTFSLTGKHQVAICEDCHSGAVDVASFTDAPTACINCHLDHHSGNLSLHCEDCHSSQSWTSIIYDHSQTGFILDGGHSSILCTACHLDLDFQGLSPDCVSCHLKDEPHQAELGADCAACHTTATWLEIQFDHSGPYSEKCLFCHRAESPVNHYPGQCSACHLTSAWLPATFDHQIAQAYDCKACHNPDTPSNHYGGQCSICHSTSWWKPSTIKHTFPINHEGASGKCTNCHNTYPAYTCYKCHEHSQSEVKNEHEGVSNLNNCIRCHWDGQKHDDDGDDD